MTDVADCRCIACGGNLVASGEPDEQAIIEARYRCEGCGKTYDEVWGVPFFLEYDREDFTGLVEIAANAGLTSPHNPQDLEDFFVMLGAYHVAEDKPTFLKNASPAHAPWIPSRYTEWVAVDRLVAGEDFAGRKVLDVGAGLGFDAYRHVLAGASVTAVEHSPVLAREGRRTLPMMRWIGGASHILPFADESFDAVFSNAALHHMRDIPAAIDEMLRVLKPGGILITSGDPYRADRDGPQTELTIFNAHPGVLLGVNEQVPRFCDFVETLHAAKENVAARIFTQILYDDRGIGGRKTIEEFREWRLEDSATLGEMAGSLAMKVHLQRATRRPARRRREPVLLTPGAIASRLDTQSDAMAHLAAIAPREVVNRPFPGVAGDKFELLNGWQSPTGDPWRQAYRRARWYLERQASDAAITFELQTAAPAAFEILLNGAHVAEASTEAKAWQRVKIDLAAAPAATPFALEIRLEGEPAAFEDGLFRVRNRRLGLTSLPSPRRPADAAINRLSMRVMALGLRGVGRIKALLRQQLLRP